MFINNIANFSSANLPSFFFFFITPNHNYAIVTLALPDPLFQRIKQSPLQRHVNSVKELNVDFIPYEPHSFHLDLPYSFSAAVNAPTPSLLNYNLEPVAKRLVSVLATLGEYPYIRYYNPRTPTSILESYTTSASSMSLSGKLAGMVQNQLDQLCRLDPSFPPPSQHPRAVLMIVDRGVDVVAPLVHEYTYQAMLNDALVLEEGFKVMLEDGENGFGKVDKKSEAQLDEFDPIFVSFTTFIYNNIVYNI